MKVYAQFFTITCATSPEDSKRLIGACGDRSVIQVDARLADCNIRQIARDECIKRKYLAWQLLKGSSLSDAKPVSDIITI